MSVEFIAIAQQKLTLNTLIKIKSILLLKGHFVLLLK
jgi:hypothetical protein